MTVSEKKAIVIGTKVRKLYGKDRVLLEKGGVDVDLADAEMGALVEEVLSLDAQQEAQKRQLVATTSALEAARMRLYVRSSGWLDMAIAAVDKNSSRARNYRRIRTQLAYQKRTSVPVARAG